MSTKGQVALEDVWAALHTCLPGWRATQKQHRWWVYPPNGGAPFMLPLGAHGRRKDVEVQRGHVKSMARQFGILDCMTRNVEGL